MNIFRHAAFHTTVNRLQDLPPTSQEIAFVGRSNSGKSSAINTLTEHNRLAYVSKTPGRTQHINFFTLKNGASLVDLPGYGFANVPLSVREHWVELLGGYLKTRSSLIGLILIMDIRHPLKDSDCKMINFFATRSLPIHVLLSKADKLSKNEQIKSLSTVEKKLNHWPDHQLKLSIQLFSSLKKTGINECNQLINQWFSNIETSSNIPK